MLEDQYRHIATVHPYALLKGRRVRDRAVSESTRCVIENSMCNACERRINMLEIIIFLSSCASLQYKPDILREKCKYRDIINHVGHYRMPPLRSFNDTSDDSH